MSSVFFYIQHFETVSAVTEKPFFLLHCRVACVIGIPFRPLLIDRFQFDSTTTFGDDGAFADQQQAGPGSASATNAPALSTSEVDLSGVFGTSTNSLAPQTQGNHTTIQQQQSSFPSPADSGPPNQAPVVAHKSAPPPPRPAISVVQAQKNIVAASPVVTGAASVPSAASSQPIIRTSTVMTAAVAPQQNIIINTQPATAVLGGQQVIQGTGQQGILQILSAAQPTTVVRTSATMTAAAAGHAKQQPHLLPKPPVVHAKPATSAPIILSQAQNVVTQQPAAAAPLLLNSMGQIVGTAAQPQSPILIQQPSGNPLILVRPNMPTVQPAQTILPVVSQGQILLQQPAAAITAQPQIKIITPQGRMQMQQIQTPSGPKLIAVPVGQTATLAPAASTGVLAGSPLSVISSPSNQGKKVRTLGGQKGTAPSNAKPVQAPIQIQGQTVHLQPQPGLQGQIQLQGQLQLVGQPAGQGQIQLTTSQPSIQIAGQPGPIQLTGQLSQGQLQIAGQPMQGQLQLTTSGQQANVQLAAQPGQIQLASHPAGQGHIQVIQQPLQQQLPQQPQQQQQNSSKGGTGDVLGDLMKDVGLDLDGFGLDDQAQSTTSDEVHLPVDPVPSAASGSQLVAQIQQPLPLQVPRH